MTHERLTYLLDQFAENRISAAERAELMLFLDGVADKELAEDLVNPWLHEISSAQSGHLTKEEIEAVLRPVFDLDKSSGVGTICSEEVHPVQRSPFFRLKWVRYAAAVIILSGLATYGWVTNRTDRQTIISHNPQPEKNIFPGGNHATLTLAGGHMLVLDSAANGQLADQGGVKVVKLGDGQLAYDLHGLNAKDIFWNTMSTPKGGQYQVLLPDGTKVWLNAISSITYPTAFTGKDRQVKITGEAFFEVAKNKDKTFIIDVDGRSSVQVLGTSFNINSYADEGNIRTTLVDGSVKIAGRLVLKPGQQAIQPSDTNSVALSTGVDPGQIVAWKNGLFSFNNTDLVSAMRQLERWYDIKVRYEGKVPELTLKGKMYRNVNLSDILDFLQKMGVKFRLEGNTLIIL